MLANNAEFDEPRGTVPMISSSAVDSHPAPQFSRCHLSIGDYQLTPLTIESKGVFDHYLSSTDCVVSDLSFTNNFIWMNRMSGFYLIIDDCFCLFSLNGDRLTMLLPPIGGAPHQVNALRVCFELMDLYNRRRHWSMVEYSNKSFVQLLEGDAEWVTESVFSDYIYNTEELIELRGNAYKTKRNEINQFMRSCPQHRLEPLQPQHHDGIRELQNTWLRDRIQNLSGANLANFLATVEMERQGIERALEHFDVLGLVGLCLIIDDKVEGFTFGERINSRVASILFEKTNFAIPAAAQYLFREFSRCFADCTYINVGDDLGLENLRRVKMSYRPAMFGERFAIRRRVS